MPRTRTKRTIKLRVYLALSLAFLPVFALSSSAIATPTQIEIAQTSLTAAQAELQAAQDNKTAADATLVMATSNLQTAQAEKDAAQATYNASAVLVPATTSTSLQNVVQNGTFDNASSWSNIGIGTSATLTNSNIARVYNGVLVGSYVYSTYVQQVGTFSSPVRQVTFSYDMSNNNDNYGNRPQADQYRVEFRTYSANGTRLNYYNTGDRADIFPLTHFSATYTLSADAVRWDVGFRMSDTGYWNGNFAGSIDNVSILANITTGTPEHTEYSPQATSDLALKVQALATAQTAYNLAVANQAAAVTRLTNATSALAVAQAALAQAQYDAIVPTSAPVISSATQGDGSSTISLGLPNNETPNTWFYRVSTTDASCTNPYANQTLNTDGAPSSFTVSSLTNGCQYQVAIANWNGKTSEYTTVTISPIEPLVLNAPTNLQVTVTGTSAHLTWDAPQLSNTSVERYAIFWSYDNFQSGFGMPSTITVADIQDLTPGSEISFKVRSDNDTNAIYSSFSPTVVVSTAPTVTPAPTTPTPTPVETAPVVVVDPTPTPTPTPTQTPVVDPVQPVIYPSDSVQITADEGAGVSYTAPEGYVISGVVFASYGTPNNFSLGDCHAVDSAALVSAAISGSTLNISADNGVFGDPCGGTYKKLEIVLTLAVDPNYIPPTPAPEPTPTPLPTATTTPEPVVVPTPEPTTTPSLTPTTEPQPTPTQSQSPQPTVEPSPTPTIPEPTPTPTPTETSSPTPLPTSEPTATPSTEPTVPVVIPSPEPTPVVEPTKDPTPVVVPVKEVTKAEDLPEVISVAQLQDIKLDEIIATDLTPKQAEALKEAALQTFETAAQGSPEYQQALDALLVAAKADDIVLSPELASIPGAAALVDAINLLSNVGADISPVVRAEAQKATVAAVIVGQIAGSAASVATSTSSSSRKAK